MKFIINSDYPSGTVVITADDIIALRAKGWTVDLHTPYYANHIGTTIGNTQVGFGGWFDGGSIGYYQPESINGIMEVKSQADLDAVVEFIDAAIKVKHIKIK
jgi:hypothetical protein